MTSRLIGAGQAESFNSFSVRDKLIKRGDGVTVNCFQCEYFYVTWDQRNPRGCKAYGFKTRELPSIVVKKSSGIECLKFARKKRDGKI